MNCRQARELLPAYVMGALDRDDLMQVEEHLRAGHEHDGELVELRTTVFALDRFADARSLEAPSPAESPRTASAKGARSGAGVFGWLRRAPAWQLAGVAAAAVALFAAGWLISGVTGNGTEQEVSLAVHGPAGQTATLTGNSSEKRVAGTMTGFERLHDDRVYQMWAIRGDTWVTIGVCNTNADGTWQGEWPFELRPGEEIAVTVEPVGGSETPTSDPVLISTS